MMVAKTTLKKLIEVAILLEAINTASALAHVVQNKVEAAYRRTDLFERRRRLMNDWAAYLSGDSGEKPGQIVSESSLGDPTG